MNKALTAKKMSNRDEANSLTLNLPKEITIKSNKLVSY